MRRRIFLVEVGRKEEDREHRSLARFQRGERAYSGDHAWIGLGWVRKILQPVSCRGEREVEKGIHSA